VEITAWQPGVPGGDVRYTYTFEIRQGTQVTGTFPYKLTGNDGSTRWTSSGTVTYTGTFKDGVLTGASTSQGRVTYDITSPEGRSTMVSVHSGPGTFEITLNADRTIRWTHRDVLTEHSTWSYDFPCPNCQRQRTNTMRYPEDAPPEMRVPMQGTWAFKDPLK
jgi:hypothetical protein